MPFNFQKRKCAHWKGNGGQKYYGKETATQKFPIAVFYCKKSNQVPALDETNQEVQRGREIERDII